MSQQEDEIARFVITSTSAKDNTLGMTLLTGWGAPTEFGGKQHFVVKFAGLAGELKVFCAYIEFTPDNSKHLIWEIGTIISINRVNIQIDKYINENPRIKMTRELFLESLIGLLLRWKRTQARLENPKILDWYKNNNENIIKYNIYDIEGDKLDRLAEGLLKIRSSSELPLWLKVVSE